MAKVTINGEAFDFDGSVAPLSEALEIEKALGIRYAQWEEDFAAGSARALAGFVWKVWHRNGRDVPLADILDGKVEVDVAEVMRSLVEAAREELDGREEAPKEPTSTDPDGTPTTGTGTSASSRKNSASAPGKSAAST